jgi:branched-chain amino acid transport system permease protein
MKTGGSINASLLRPLPFALVLLCLPLLDSGYLTNMAIIVALHALPALGLSLLMGFSGQISLGHAAFYGLGAYGSALLSLRLGLSPWLATPVAVLATGLAGYGLGRAIFRLRGHHLALATLGLGVVVSIGFIELRGLTGGAIGLSGIPPFRLFGFALDTDDSFFVFAWAICGLAFLAAWNLVDSPAGLAMRGLGDSERGAAAVGLDVARLKCQVLALSAMLAALGGALYAHYIGFISPQPFGVAFSIKLLVMVAIGGFRSVGGVLTGVAFATLITEPLQDLGYYDVVAFGALLAVITILCPDGLLQTLVHGVRRLARLRTARAG